ncbi:hypothetical protein [Mycolicibacterium goodii]|uniref:hypothetical protein n=1 Tax=Mycolicibacterium goodii TaxID=134601 RepID=UPI0018EBC333|nr:hypothetical protein [Mycolicibacterium goodii]
MTAAGNFRLTASRTEREISVAGVPWPAYKLIALAVAALVLLLVAAVTMTASTAVLSAAGAGTVTWLVLGKATRASRH